MSRVECREASSDDLPAILELYAQPAVDDGEVVSVAEAESILARMRRYPDYTLYVADDDGRVVGSFSLLIMDNLAHRGAPSAVVEDVVVAPERQGQGVGTAMMRYAMDIAAGKGCYKLVLSSNAAREDAHAFYESLGFERHGYSFRVSLEQR